MDDVTAEMIERHREGDPAAAAERRRSASRVRQAREKLTSTGSGHHTFDVELLRLFAERHREAALPALAVTALAAGVALFWLPPVTAALWFAAACGGLGLQWGWVRAFLAEDAPGTRLRAWYRRFATGEAMIGASWATLGPLLMRTEEPTAQTFVLFALLLVGATTALLSACVPLAVTASLLPITLGVGALAGPLSGQAALPLLMLAGGALVFFLVLSRRLYQTRLATLAVQAEKDALIVELEQARLNSDEARRRAEEASLAKSRFLATMSHELRTPLNAILGFSEVMKGELFGPHAVPDYREYSGDIHSSGQHLLMLINEILDLSRVEAGRYELKEESIALALVVEDCRHLLALRAGKRDITLVDHVESGLPRIWADERAIRQVILNLLSNAIKFTPQGGTVTIKVGWTAQGGQYVAIRDTGPGIPEHEIPVVMSSFGRGTLAQKNAEEGSGLGLPIVKGLVELHGGTFTLRSKVREGTEVVVVLPPERVIDALPPIGDDTVPNRRRTAGLRPAA